MFRRLQVGVLFIVLPLIGLYMYLENQNIPLSDIFEANVDMVHVGEIPMRVEIADTDEERVQGLSGRAQLGDTDGFLFVFPKPDRYGFWMKDMQFAVDIIWISKELVVVGVDRNVQPSSYPHMFRPPQPVQFVIETNANYTETFGIGVGKKVRLPLTVEQSINI